VFQDAPGEDRAEPVSHGVLIASGHNFAS
jgi:hypothetical protein